MIMAGFFCMKQIPFKQVYIHGTVRDLTGKKMSKSLGNIIDPLEIIQQFGSDALRYTLVTSTAIGQDIFLSEEKFIAGRNFANKLWNVTRYVLGSSEEKLSFDCNFEDSQLSVADRWILSRLNHTISHVTRQLDKLSFNEAAHSIYDFLWRDYCDWYVELSKVVPPERKTITRAILIHVLENSLRLLHPIMPFVTEELWQHLKDKCGASSARGPSSIMISKWPKPDKKLIDSKAESDFEIFQAVVGAIRNTKAELNVPNDSRPSVLLSTTRKEIEEFLRSYEVFLCYLAQIKEAKVGKVAQRPGDAAATVVGDVEVIIPLAGFIDVVKERSRIQTRLTEIKDEFGRLDSKLKDRQFVQRAPKEIVEQTRQRHKQVKDALDKFNSHMRLLEGM
jgi:valyl-tRNA synthetase